MDKNSVLVNVTREKIMLRINNYPEDCSVKPKPVVYLENKI